MNTTDQHIIDSLQKAQPALPPDGYFEQLKTDLLRQAVTPKVVPLYRRKWLIGSAAASVILVVGLFLARRQTETTPQPGWEAVSKEEVIAYIEDNIEDFEAESIAAHVSHLPEWQQTAVPVSTSLETPAAHTARSYDELLQQLNKNEILEYLQEDVIDMDDELLISN